MVRALSVVGKQQIQDYAVQMLLAKVKSWDKCEEVQVKYVKG